MMERVHEVNNGSFRTRSLFKALTTPGRKATWGTLLYMTKYMNGKVDNMCYLHVMGTCRDTYCKEQAHPKANKLAEGFVDELFMIVTPAVPRITELVKRGGGQGSPFKKRGRN